MAKALVNHHFDILETSRQSQMAHRENRDSLIVCFVGEPGIGKTQTVHAYAESINYAVDTLILGNIPPVDIGGIYAPDFQRKELVHFVTTRLIGGSSFPADKDGLIVFFDEIGSAAEDTQVAIQSLLQEMAMDGREVDPGVMFVCATNLPEHTGGANDLVASLRSRLCFVQFRFNMESWFRKARTEWGIVPELYSFHQWKEGSALLGDNNATSTALSNPDPRGWNKVNFGLRAAMKSKGCETAFDLFAQHGELVRMIVAGQVGEPMSQEFCGFLKAQGCLPTVREVINTPDSASVPAGSCEQYAIVYNLEYAMSQLEEAGRIPGNTIEAVYTYIKRLPRPMAVLAFRKITKTVEQFTKHRCFGEFREEFKSLLTM